MSDNYPPDYNPLLDDYEDEELPEPRDESEDLLDN